MSSLIVQVHKIKSIEKHPNADKLSIVEVGNGWHCIVGLDQYKQGDLVVFCPPDSIIPPAIVDKYNLEYLKKSGRVSTTKLRGYISQGLILDLPNKKLKEGDDVANLLGITKYEAPEPSYSGNGSKQTSKKKINPNFHKYTEIENIKNFSDIFTKEDIVVITEKIHGCLEKKTKILLSDGSTKSIGEIVDNKLDVECLGKDKNGEIVSTKILNWFNNGKTKDWLKVSYERRGFGTQGSYFGALKCTPNHKIFSPAFNKYVEAKSLHVGDNVLLIKNIEDLSYLQESVLVGKMLGDGSYYSKSEKSASISFSHKKEHEEYLNYTINCLGDIAGNKQTEIISGYGTMMARGRTQNLPSIYICFSKWFNDSGKKIVPQDIKLNPISLAFWYMDDGSMSHHEKQEDRINLAACSFSENDIDILLNALNIQCDINAEKYLSSKKYWRIRINAKDTKKFFTLIAPYVCKTMQYKLPYRFRQLNVSLSEDMKKYYNICVEKEIIKIQSIENTRSINTTKYDIETETHNFFANEILVHNSNARYGLLKIEIGNNIPVLDKISMWIQKYILKKEYEYVCGSHNMQLTQYSNTKKTFYKENVWDKAGKKYNMKDVIQTGMIIYGEVYGAGIQKDLTYGLDEPDLVVFDIKVDGKYMNWNVVKDFCNAFGLKHVPELYAGKYSDKIVEKLTIGNSILCPDQIREGCVVKMFEEENHPRIGRKILKSVNAEYLARKDRSEYK